MIFVRERIGNISAVSLIGILIIILLISIVFAVSIGVVSIPFRDVWEILIYNVFDKISFGTIQLGDPSVLGSGMYYDIVWNIRSPRVFLAAIVGMTLAMAGVVMQATVQNPLADPYILGMSSGASLGATVAIAIGATTLLGVSLGSASIAVFAFIGSIIASFSVLGLSALGGRMTTTKLILSGTIISSLMGAFSNLIIVLFADAEEMQSITYWLLGSFGSAQWYKIGIPLLAFIIVLLYFITQLRNLNTMLFGDEVATTLGVDLAKKRVIYVTFTAVLTACAVCFCGVIGFVGLMIPHIVRGITGNNHWKLMPLSILVGGIFMIWADILARTILSGAELPIGIITAVCGAPIFAYIMIKKTYTFN